MPLSTSPRLLLVGGGYLAQHAQAWFINAGWQVSLVDIDQLDISQSESVASYFSSYSFEIVLNLAAYTNTAEAEKISEHDSVLQANLIGPLNLFNQLKGSDTHLIHISTGMFFDGAGPSGTGWQETDLAEPANFYSWSKYWADQSLISQLELVHGIIARIHTPISGMNHPRNYLQRLIGFEKVVDIPQSVTALDDLWSALKYLLENDQTGLYNIVNQGTITAYQIAEMLRQAGLRSTAPEPLSRESLDETSQKTGAAKQSFPVLSIAKLNQAGFNITSTIDAIKRDIGTLQETNRG